MLQVMECPCCNTERRSRQHARESSIQSLKFGVASLVWLKKKKASSSFPGTDNLLTWCRCQMLTNLLLLFFSSIFYDVAMWAFKFVRSSVFTCMRTFLRDSCSGMLRQDM